MGRERPLQPTSELREHILDVPLELLQDYSAISTALMELKGLEERRHFALDTAFD